MRMMTLRALRMSAALLFSLGLVLPLPSSAAHTDEEFNHLFLKGRRELKRWNYETAERISQALLEDAKESGDPARLSKARRFRASYCFYLGDYACARDQLELQDQGKGEPQLELLERARILAEVWKNAKHQKSEHFILRYIPGKDEVLVEPALETLERAYAVFSRQFKLEADSPILVEIYPSFEGFQANTHLSPEAVEKSGTVAVCKYRRLMLNSPRLLARGYDYRNTLAHELVHWFIYKKFGPGVPIWLHEGIAKHQESRWRLRKGGELTPAMKSLLASALRLNEFITFDRMHPSFAYLETPTQGQLAFAEVTVAVDYLIHLGGWELVERLCRESAKTDDYRLALKRALNQDLEEFWRGWADYARSLGFKELPGLEITALEIRKGEEEYEDEGDEEISESDLQKGEEWEKARLGDLLRNRGHFAAAAFEYENALALAPYSLVILNKTGLNYYLAEDYKNAVSVLSRAAELYPNHSTTYINLGRAFYAMGEKEEARKALEKALDINPFNPLPYGPLIAIYRERGEDEKVRILARNYNIITGKNQNQEEP